MSIVDILFEHQDLKYKEFTSKLIPDISSEKIIGVRVPVVRSIANALKNSEDANKFVDELPHEYCEENNLHAFLICRISDFDECIEKLNRFLPYVDNWATCDSIRPISFKKEKKKLLAEIRKWIQSEHTFTVRFAIEMLMTHYLDSDFSDEIHNLVLQTESDEYYIKMMIAWYFATALAKQWHSTVTILESKMLTPWIHNKTIQKAVESYRITDEQKAYLRTLKIKTTV